MKEGGRKEFDGLDKVEAYIQRIGVLENSV